eukprot:CAMPEP_0119346110 /NCGR_PEP_ID=MMETSP1333-20130426/107837_1 /TAXON_ID=418940 /ORGANISM="Scyphosphaera apsteinii, Strain RCC1455" /LENGTH=325 /DNA_ID=CAMNT_0007358609 /DNA_START=994 /DNA_END=1967 /DNA_ORIENTATION=+
MRRSFAESADVFKVQEPTRSCPSPDWPLNDIAVLGSLPVCKRECYWNPNCVGMVYDTVAHNCWLKSKLGKPALCDSPRRYMALEHSSLAPPNISDTCIIMWYTANCKHCALAELLNRWYAARWGYRLLSLHDELSSPIVGMAWSTVRAALDGLSRCGAIFKMDADAVFNLPDISIESGWLAPARRLCSSSSGGHACEPSIVISDDGNAPHLINTGVWWASATAHSGWACTWLTQLLAAPIEGARCAQWRNAPIWEQSCWDALLRTAGARERADVPRVTGGRMRLLGYERSCHKEHAPWPNCDTRMAFVLHVAAAPDAVREAILLR